MTWSYLNNLIAKGTINMAISIFKIFVWCDSVIVIKQTIDKYVTKIKLQSMKIINNQD